MTSQSPDSQEQSDPGYESAWQALTHMLLNEGASFSGRERNCFFQNLGTGPFANISAASGLDFDDDSRGMAKVDWDGDGKLDFFLKNRNAPRIRFLHNRSQSKANWLQLELRGNHCNRDAIGARVTVKTKQHTFSQSVRAGDSYLTQSSLRLHFGLGTADAIQDVTVLWPSGHSQKILNIQPNEFYRLEEGQAATKMDRTLQPKVAKGKHRPLAKDANSSHRILLREPFSLSGLALPAFDNPQRKVADLSGKPSLITFWATWCTSCHQLFADLDLHKEIFKNTDFHRVLMTTDEPNKLDQAKREMTALGWSEGSGQVNPTLLKGLAKVFQEVVGYETPLALPTSLLLDPQGNLMMIYLGPIPAQQLRLDLEIARQSRSSNNLGFRKSGIWTGTSNRPPVPFP